MHGHASLAPRTAHPRTCTWPSIPCAAPHSYLFTLHLTHAPRPSHMHPGPHTCTPALTHAPRPSHMHPGPHTCTPALTHVPRPSHMYPGPHTCHPALTHATRPSHMYPGPHTCTPALSCGRAYSHTQAAWMLPPAAAVSPNSALVCVVPPRASAAFAAVPPVAAAGPRLELDDGADRATPPQKPQQQPEEGWAMLVPVPEVGGTGAGSGGHWIRGSLDLDR